MPLKKLQMTPGMNREGTQYTNEGKWYDGDKVRFRKGLPESIGGWEKRTPNTFQGVCRSIFRWNTLADKEYYTIGTNLKYYLLNGNSFDDITPIRVAAAGLASNPFTTVNESTTVIVADSSHGAEEGDFVIIASAATTRGIPAADLNKEHQIVTVPDTGTYTISVDTAATSSGTGGGTAPPTVEYQINTGLETSVLGQGWGAGTWGRGTWDSAADIIAHGILRIWHQDKWGEDLIFNPRLGPIYFWDASDAAGTRAGLLSAESGADNVPTIVTQILISQIDRHLNAYGCNPLGSSTHDPLFVRWSDQENNVDWDPTAVNTSGSQRLSVGSRIIGAINTSRGETLIWTDRCLYSQQYIGPPFTYGFRFMAGNVSLIGPLAAGFIDSKVYWMDRNNFYVYDGTTKAIKCDLLDYVFDDINKSEYEQVFIAPNTHFNEVSWHYCSASSSVIDRYVTYNYEENIWYFGTLDRTAWISEEGINNPLATSTTGGILFKHEYGVDDDGSALNSYIESSDIDMDDGNEFMYMHRIIPDIGFTGTATSKTADLITKKRNYNGDTLSTHKTQAVTDTTKQIFPRLRTRQAVIRFESNTIGVGWRLGHMRLELQPDGER